MGIQIGAALFAVYVFWGATFLAMRVAVESFPPMVMVAFRFISVGVIMLLWVGLKEGKWRIEKDQWKGLFLTGTGLFVLGNGVYAYALRYIPSSVATLIGATGAIWMVLLDWRFRGMKPGKVLVGGLVIAMIGIVFLTGKPETGGLDPFWLVVCLMASFFWTASSYGMRLFSMPDSAWLTVGWQNLLGGLVCALWGVVQGEWSTFTLDQVSSRSWLGMFYLVFIGSMIGFSSYRWLVVRVSPVIAATTSLVNPVVAMFFGWLLLDEPFTTQIALAFVLVLTGVIAITFGRNREVSPLVRDEIGAETENLEKMINEVNDCGDYRTK